MTTTQRITTSAVLALAFATSAAPTLARPYDIDGNGSYVPAGSASVQAHSLTKTPIRPVNTSAPVVRVTTHNSGFDWDSAGIGAAGGLALSTIGLGAALAVSQRRTRRTRHTSALIG